MILVTSFAPHPIFIHLPLLTYSVNQNKENTLIIYTLEKCISFRYTINVSSLLIYVLLLVNKNIFYST